MKKWSIDVGNNFVVDASGVGRLFGAGPSIPLVTNYGRITRSPSDSGRMTFFPLVRSVTPAMNRQSPESTRKRSFHRMSGAGPRRI